MMNKHAKSPCCNAPARRYGKRRRQCVKCFSTWSIRKKKRGRKSNRPKPTLLQNILDGKETAADAAKRRGVRPATLQKHVRQAMSRLSQKTPFDFLPTGRLVLVVDGLWTYFHKEGRFTLYLMAIRAANDAAAHFLDPVLLPGQENLEGWRSAMATISDNVRRRICAMVSDGLRGLKKVAEEQNWLFQRCHFHLLAGFQKRHGQYFQRGKSKWIRDAILAYIRVMLETIDLKKSQEFRRELESLTRHPDCPRYLVMRVHEFLRTLDDFQTCLRHPELNLPTTSNTAETMIRLLRNLLRRIRGTRTPQSFLRWTTAFIRNKKTIVCNGKFNRIT